MKCTSYAEPVLPDGVLNSAGVGAKIEVKVLGPGEALAAGDTYVNDGGKANDNFGSANTLHIKLDGSGYQREALFQFDITGLEEDADQYMFQVSASMDNGFQGGAIYQVESGWDPATVTWNTKSLFNIF